MHNVATPSAASSTNNQKRKRGRRDFSRLNEELLTWAKEVVNEANAAPIDSMQQTVKDSRKLTEVLIALVQEKEKVKQGRVDRESRRSPSPSQ